MSNNDLKLSEINQKTIILGLTYFDLDGSILQQRQLAGKVVKVTEEDGITLLGFDNQSEFTIPSDLSPWFIAPEGDYPDPNTGQKISNPDYLVTWDIHKTQNDAEEGDHEWWEWRPQLVKPSVGD